VLTRRRPARITQVKFSKGRRRGDDCAFIVIKSPKTRIRRARLNFVFDGEVINLDIELLFICRCMLRRRLALLPPRFHAGALKHLTEALSSLGGECIRTKTIGDLSNIALVRPRLDLAQNTLPVLLVRIVPLDHHVELVSHARIANLLAAKNPQPAIGVLAGDCRLDLLDAHEVLLVERAQTFHALSELINEHLDLSSLHGYRRSSRGSALGIRAE
jgi:hypothetical protein